MRTARSGDINTGVAINVADGPVTAATEFLHWGGVLVSVVNLVVIALFALIVAVAVIPVEASEHRFDRSR